MAPPRPGLGLEGREDLACRALPGVLWDLGVPEAPAGLPFRAGPLLPWHLAGTGARKRARRRGPGLGARVDHIPCGSDPASHSAPARASCAPAAGWPPAAVAPWPPRRPRPPPACGGSAAKRPGPANPLRFWAQWRRRPGALRRPRRRWPGSCLGLGQLDSCARPPAPGGSRRSGAVPQPALQGGGLPTGWARSTPGGSEPVILLPFSAVLTVPGAWDRGFLDGWFLTGLGCLLAKHLLSHRWRCQGPRLPKQTAPRRNRDSSRSGRPRL